MRDRIHDVPEVSAYTVRARRLEIVDDDGLPRAKIYTADDGTPVIGLYNRQQNQRLGISLDDGDMAGVTLFTSSDPEIPLVSIRIRDEIPELVMYDPDGRLRSVVYLEENRPAFNLYDHKERLRLSLYLNPDGTPVLALFDETEQPVMEVVCPDKSGGI